MQQSAIEGDRVDVTHDRDVIDVTDGSHEVIDLTDGVAANDAADVEPTPADPRHEAWLLRAQDAAARIVRRLLGPDDHVGEVVSVAVASREYGDHDDLAVVARVAVEECLLLRRLGALDDHGDDPHRAHRARIARELTRWSPADRTVLALRHLAGFGIGDVGRLTGRSGDDVRRICGAWRPDDAAEPDVDLLADLDSWIGTRFRTGDGAPADGDPAADPLAHLD